MLQMCENPNELQCGKVAVYRVDIVVPEFELDGRVHPEKLVDTTYACAYCADGVEPGPSAPLPAVARKTKRTDDMGTPA